MGGLLLRKKQKIILRQDNAPKDTNLNQNKEFLNHFQISLLFALLEKNLITQYQFEQCSDEILKSSTQILKGGG
jgi:hypothetical protein